MIHKIIIGILVLMMAIIGACWKGMGVVLDSHTIYVLLFVMLGIMALCVLIYLCKEIHKYIAPLINPYLEECKQWLRDTWRKFVKWLRPNLPNKNDVQFQSLAPTDDAQQTEIYEEALTQALLNKNIYNIAITGAFGSGKSSFLRTYFKKYPNLWPLGGKKNKVITVSLANLANNAETPGTPSDVNQKVELSILHQLFFHERATSLTDSHFTKIQKFGFWKLWFYTSCLVLYTVSCIHLLWPSFWTTTLRLEELQWNISAYRTWWHWIFVGISIAGTIWVSRYLIRVIAQLTVRKLSVETAKIEIASKREKSILNEHVDEIIYFFSVTGYNVVLIEDLDRLKQQGIFVKLREINHLINNSEEVKQRVRFIYALKDDMFKDETRTKFFDFIIPIIPRVDASNAGDALRGLIPGYLGHAADAVAMYLNDARTLSNIANEFNIYKHQQQQPNIRGEEQLFALVIYKNLYPDDFEELRLHNGGLLATALKQRNELVKQKIDQIDEKVAKLRTEIANIKYEQSQSEKELRYLLVGLIAQEAISKTDAYGQYTQVKVGNLTYTISSLTNEDTFNAFIKATTFEYRSLNGRTTAGTTIKNLMEDVYGDLTYEERLRRIKDRAKVPQYEDEVKQLIAERTPVKQQTIQYLLQSKQLEIKWGKEYEKEEYDTQRRFIIDMLRGGYITDDYADYISFFHEGAMTNEDNEFVRNVKMQVTGEKELNLTFTKRIIDCLDISHFSQPVILHVRILDELLEDYSDEEKCNLVVKMLEQYSETMLQFILKYSEDGKCANLLFERLCADTDNLWKKVRESKMPEDDRIILLKSIITYGKEEDVVRNLQGSAEFLAKKSDYFKWEIDEQRLKNIAKALDVHFEAIEEGVSEECLRYVYENSLYMIKPAMLRRVIPASQRNEELFKKANYTYLNTSDLPDMLNYVNGNIEEYVENVLMPLARSLEKPIEEEYEYIDWDTFEGVLEDEPEHIGMIIQHYYEIEDNALRRLVQREKKKWETVDAYGDIPDEAKLWLYHYQKVEVTWENALYLYKLDKAAFEEYIRKGDVAFKLSSKKPDFDDEEREDWNKMQDDLLSDKIYESVAEELIWCFDKEFDASVIKHCRTSILEQLIDRKLIARGTDEYDILHVIDPSLSLSFFLQSYEEFAPKIEDLEFDDYDIDALLRQKDYLDEERKLNVLEHVKADEIVDKRSIKTLVEFFMHLDRSKYEIREGVWKVIKAVLMYADMSTPKRLKLFNKYPLIVPEEIDQVVALLDRQYVDENGKLHEHLQPVTDEILRFSKYLESIHYLRVSRDYTKSKGYISIRYKL